MKTTLDLPDRLLREAKATAARKGLSLKGFVAEAIGEKLAAEGQGRSKPWLRHFGALGHLRSETRRIERIIDENFERIDPEGWA